MISITVNGAQRQLEPSTSIADLLREMALEGKRIAIERNGEIAPRSQFSQQMLQDGDKLEIVVAVGGG